MKRTLAFTCLFVCLWSLPIQAETETPQTGAFTPGAGRGIVSPAIQLPLSAKPPVMCSTETRGTMALDSNTHLCVCDGQNWKIANTDEACGWTVSAR
jgi:hypothetical protein